MTRITSSVTTAMARTIQARMLVPSDGSFRSSVMDESEKSRSKITSTSCTAVLAKVSIAPEAIAVGGVIPCRWKKRMFTAMRARLEGRARFM